MLLLDRILGSASEPEISDALHRLSHHGTIEYLVLSPADMKRHRLRTRTDLGSDCAIALPRDENMRNGSVLLLTEERAIVVRMREQPTILVRPLDTAAALELGYLAGNMHWKVGFRGEVLAIAQEGEEAAYLTRLAPLLDTGRAARVTDAD